MRIPHGPNDTFASIHTSPQKVWNLPVRRGGLLEGLMTPKNVDEFEGILQPPKSISWTRTSNKISMPGWLSYGWFSKNNGS